MSLAAGLLLAVLPQAAGTEAAVDAVVRAVDRERDIAVGVRVETLDGTLVYDHDGATPRVLASNTKLLTTAAALLAFEPDLRWRTACLLEDDVLWIVGDGDPTLRRLEEEDAGAAFLDALAVALRARGVSALDGVVLDDRAFDRVARHPLWPEDQWQREYCAPISALLVEGGCVAVRTDGGRLLVEPPLGDALQVRTVHEDAAFGAWWQEPDAVLTVQGRSSARGDARVAVRDPLAQYAAWIAHGLRARGIRAGIVRAVEAGEARPHADPLLEHASAWTVAEAVVVVNKDSDNTVAEALFKTLGHRLEGVGSFAAGARAVTATLREAGLDEGEWSQADGSGMARAPDRSANRASPATLCALLRLMATRPEGRVFFHSLPIGGVDSRLAARFREPVFQPRRVRAKTGFIHGASSLSGYLHAGGDATLVFSIVVNFERDGTARTNNRRFKRMQERILAEVLETWPRR